MRKSILSLIFSALLVSMGLTTSSNAISVPEGLGIGFSIGTAGYYAEGEEKTDNQKTGEDMAKDGGAFQHDVGSIILEYKDLDQLNKVIEIIKSNYWFYLIDQL